MYSEHFEKFINQDFPSFSDWLFSLDPYEFTMISVVAGFLISPMLTVNQQNSLGNFFETLGQILLTVNAQTTTLQQASNSKYIKNLESEISKLKKELMQLRQKISEKDE